MESNKFSVPLAIIVAGLLVAGAIIYTSKNGGTARTNNQNNPQAADALSLLEEVREVSDDDHLRGSLDAKVVIVEYSDTECPFCKRFHESMKQVMGEYGASGNVAWVYRHFPLEQLHSKAKSEAVALECAAELGGNEKFWAYTDRIYEITPANDGLDPAELPKIAQYVGLDVNQFKSCLTSGKHEAKVEADLANALATGGNGTPWSIVISESGKKYPLSGAQPYPAIKQLIETALKD